MKKFILKVVFFLLPIAILAISIEILLRNIPNEYIYKKEYLEKHSNEIQTLILGSSHTYYGLNPDFLTNKAFNVAHISQSLDLDYAIFKKYYANFSDLQTVIIPISYFTLYNKLENESEKWRMKNYTIYYDIDFIGSFADYSEVLSNNQKINYNKLYDYYLLRDHKQNTTCTKLGWGTSYKSENAADLNKTGIVASKRHTQNNIHSNQNQEYLNENVFYLNSIIQLCKDRDIKVILLTPPAFESYRQNINIEQYNKTITTANSIASKYDNCVYINLFDDTNFVSKDFYDADHLSEIGAKKLSQIIDKKINQNI